MPTTTGKFVLFATLAGSLLITATRTRAAADSPWSRDRSLHGFAAGMTGDVAVRGVAVDVDVGFDRI
jgi:hypothetical protein